VARARNIKPGFFKNEVLAEMPMETRMLFIGLWTLADREGRLEDRPRRIKGDLFAYDSFDVDPMLDRLQTDEFIIRYEADGRRLIQIENFVKHQDPHYKEKASEIPAPAGMEDVIKATGVTRGKRARILERDNYKCQSCSATEHLCVDHIIPASRGGDSSDDNLQVLCHGCNTKKGNKLDGELKGVKKGTHNSSSVLTRFNVGPNSNQRNGASPSDSLTPDSGILTPESGLLNPDSSSPKNEDSGAPVSPTLPPPAFLGDANQAEIPVRAVVQISPAWELPEAWGVDSEALGWKPPEILHESEKFRQYWVVGKGADKRKSLKGWRQSWSNWLVKAEHFRRVS
jgi:hypothetical protein